MGRRVSSFYFLLFAKVRPTRPASLFLWVTRNLSISKCRAAQATRCAQLPDKLLTAAADKQSGLIGCPVCRLLSSSKCGLALNSHLLPLAPTSFLCLHQQTGVSLSSTDLGRWQVKCVGDLLIDGVLVYVKKNHLIYSQFLSTVMCQFSVRTTL